MITSEIRKIYKKSKLNTGAAFYTVFYGDTTDEKPDFAQTDDKFVEKNAETGQRKIYECTRTKGVSKWELIETIDSGGSDDEGGSSALPAVTSDDNGKVLTVVEGAWDAAELPEAEPFIITMTPDENNPLLVVGDKTFGEIGIAMSAGVHCTIVMDLTSIAGIAFSLPVLGFSDGSGGSCAVYVADVNANGLEMITGAANAYPTKNLAG